MGRSRSRSRSQDSRKRKRRSHSSSSSTSSSSRERYRTRKSTCNDSRVEATYTPEKLKTSSHNKNRERSRSHSSVGKSSNRSRNDFEVYSCIAKLEALVERLSRKSDDVEKCLRINVRSDYIPEFSPENPNLTASKWLKKIDQLKEINGWVDVATIYHMQSSLAGMAKSWYHSLADYNRTWSSWKRLTLKSFPGHSDYAALLRQMLDRKKRPGESITYTTSKKWNF